MRNTSFKLHPIISCLCVTHNKPKMLARVIRHFLQQSYPNKQLVIVYQESDRKTSEFVSKCKFPNEVKVISVSEGSTNQTLGDLRNLSIAHADGDYICQWDDDDYYHIDRLKKQYEFIKDSNLDACVLEQWIIYDACSGKFYVSNKRLWEGSLMCKTSVAKGFIYPSIAKGEDSCLIDYLVKFRNIGVLQNHPELYVYVYHGNNTWEKEHFNLIFKLSNELVEDKDLMPLRQLINI